MPASFDYVAKEGDTAPLFADTLSLKSGQPIDLTGSTVTLVIRSRAGIAMSLPVSVVNAALGQIQYVPTVDSPIPAGYYTGVWMVELPTGPMSFPTQGYLNICIEEALTTAPSELVTVADAKDKLGISSNDRTHDARLARVIAAARPVVENITGPVIPTVFDEWHRGGGPFIQLRRTPSTSYTTEPILSIIADPDFPTLGVKEYWGTQEYPLEVVGSPNLGSTYSCMIDGLGTITRLTSAGGTGVFTGGESVRVIYRAGQSSVPPNVTEGTLELIRANYELTQPSGGGRFAQADDLDQSAPLGFYVPRGVRELLSGRRAPAVA